VLDIQNSRDFSYARLKLLCSCPF